MFQLLSDAYMKFCSFKVQGGDGGWLLGWYDLDLGSFPGWWAATVAAYCPSRMV